MANAPSPTPATNPHARWRANPYLHVGLDRIFNPHTDRHLEQGQPGYAMLRTILERDETVDELPTHELRVLAEEGWLVRADRDPARLFYLKYVALEAHTLCSQACFFCPVRTAPREPYFMPTELFERIVEQLTAFRDTLDAVILMNYNEPTVDHRFVDQCRTIVGHGLPAAVLSNGSGLTPAKVDALVASARLTYLSINLSTLDREAYARDRGRDQLDLVLRHLDYAKDRPVAETMEIVVLGTGDEEHGRQSEAITRRFAGSRFAVKPFEIMDRAGWLPVGLRPERPHSRLRGCQNSGSRPVQHLHVTPQGRCVLCCEDYDEKHVVGDLTTQTVEEVLSGPELARLRRWTYGVEEAPGDYLCRRCIFALSE